ncbi:MAG: 3-isopropylmalate dehydratase large subunit [Candidatus Peregrinibacteria bacterium]|nr:3-isopropylmalate dehydratase large subunit [Candidatus Peregrinibacteria bacterium]
MTPRNIIEKIWDTHVVEQKQGQPAIFAIDLQLLHEVTSAQAFDVIRERQMGVWNRGHFLATVDHSVPTRKNRAVIYDLQARKQVEAIRSNVEQFEIPFFDFDSGYQGIVHVIGPELGITQPGLTIVCGDSHTSTHGAFGALAFGVGTTEVGLVMATGCILQQKPKTMRVNFEGEFRPGVFSKDAVLALIAQIGIGGANGYIIEYAGSAVRLMSMEERMTLCNMSIECGARAGLVSPDETTFDYIKGRAFAPKDEEWDKAVESWREFASDEGATYDHEITIDVDDLEPMITWGTNPGQGMGINDRIPCLDELPEHERVTAEKALEYIQLEEGNLILDTPLDWVFLGSCTNARISDLRIAADILNGRKIHPDLVMYVVPGSEQVSAQAEREGLDQIFIEAGADWRKPGCSMCLGMNDDKVPDGARCLSSSNRNFVGRQGPGSRTHLASPATVAASAIAGKISSPAPYFN